MESSPGAPAGPRGLPTATTLAWGWAAHPNLYESFRASLTCCKRAGRPCKRQIGGLVGSGQVAAASLPLLELRRSETMFSLLLTL